MSNDADAMRCQNEADRQALYHYRLMHQGRQQMSIDFDFACQDDCLDRMLPSDLRMLVRERDKAVKDAARIRAQRDRMAQLLRRTSDEVGECCNCIRCSHTGLQDDIDTALAELDKEEQQ